MDKLPPPMENTDKGQLILYRVETEMSKTQPVGSSVLMRAASGRLGQIQTVPQTAMMGLLSRPFSRKGKVKKPPTILSGSVLKMTVEENTVSMWVSFWDPHGPIEDLKDKDIQIQVTVYGQSKNVSRKKVKFRSRKDQHLAVALVRDVSGSINAAALKNSANAAEVFLDRLDDDDITSLIYFSGKVDVISNFTPDKNKIKNRLYHQTPEGMGSPVYDALKEALIMTEKMNNRYLKVVVAMADGHDNTSDHSANDVLELARRYSIPICIVGVGMVDESVLRTITSSTNGIYIPATDTKMLRSVYKTLSDTFDKSYLISYPLSTKPGDEVETHIKAEFERDGEDYIGEAVCSTDWIR